MIVLPEAGIVTSYLIFSKLKSRGGTLTKFSPSNFETVVADKVCSSCARGLPFAFAKIGSVIASNHSRNSIDLKTSQTEKLSAAEDLVPTEVGRYLKLTGLRGETIHRLLLVGTCPLRMTSSKRPVVIRMDFPPCKPSIFGFS